MAWGVIGLIIAGVAFSDPPATLSALMGLLSAFGLVGGIVLIIAAVRVRGAAKELSGAMPAYSHAANR